MITPAEAVANGAQLLDEKEPGWWRHIDLLVLNVESPSRCVCAQLGRARSIYWTEYVQHLGLHASLEWGRHGFHSQGVFGAYNELTHEWRLAIQARLDADRLDAERQREKMVAERKETILA